MKKLLALLAVLGLSTLASAGVIVTGNRVADAVDLGTGYLQYTIVLHADNAADAITAWDGLFTGDLRQRMSYNSDDDVYSKTIFKPTSTATWVPQDSHFMVFSDQALAVTGGAKPFENNDGIAAGTSYWGKGNLGGAFGLDTSLFSTNFVLAQIVLPVGVTAQMTGQSSNSVGVKYDTIATVGVPEPMTLSLLAFSALGLIRRKHA